MHPSNTPLRYPGGKGKLTNFVKRVFEENGLLDGHYVEPYAGGCGIAVNLLLQDYASCVHLNDINMKAVYAFWHSVINSTDDLCKKITDTRVSMTQWRKQWKIHRQPDEHSLLDLGFSTFFMNRTNRSGILTGGVIGGKEQTGKWKINARYNKKVLCDRIEKIALYRTRIRLYNLDAAALIAGVIPSLPKKSLVYLDPPYYVKSERLYRNLYDHADHAAISKLVKQSISVPWIVSYDYAPEILAMYKGGCKSIVYGMNYSAGTNRYEGSEAMFFSPKLSMNSRCGEPGKAGCGLVQRNT